MAKDKVTLAVQFFGRILKADLACPSCGRIQSIHQKSSNWDAHLCRFKCGNEECGRTFDLGIVAWTPRSTTSPALDQLYPRVRPAHGLPGGLLSRYEPDFRRRRDDATNLQGDAVEQE